MNPADATLLAAWHVALRELLLVLAIGIAISGVDDLFIDLVFFCRTVWRRLTIYRRHQRATAQSMRRADPAPIAIIVPAWDESAVIGAMLANLLARLDYPDFHVFVGLYPNDPAGIAVVAGIADPRLHTAICTRPGPTTKADCLNHLWAAVVDHEATGIR